MDLQHIQLVVFNILTDLLYLLSSWSCGFQLWCLQRARGAENLWRYPQNLWKHLISGECSWHQQVSRHLGSCSAQPCCICRGISRYMHKWVKYSDTKLNFLFRDALLLRTKPEDMVALLHTNLLGTMLTCRAALRSMLHTQGAAIVNTGDQSNESSGNHDYCHVFSLVTRWWCTSLLLSLDCLCVTDEDHTGILCTFYTIYNKVTGF